MRIFVLFWMLFYVEDGFCQSIKDDKVYFPKSCLDAGNIKQTEDFFFLIPFQNIGASEIRISYIHESGNTAPVYKKEVIRQGQWDTIKAYYYTEGRVGPFLKVLTVKFEGSDTLYYLKIQGCVTSFQGKVQLSYIEQKKVTKEIEKEDIIIEYNKGQEVLIQIENQDTFDMNLSVLDNWCAFYNYKEDLKKGINGFSSIRIAPKNIKYIRIPMLDYFSGGYRRMYINNDRLIFKFRQKN